MLKSLRTFTLVLLAFIAGGLITLDAAGVTRISFGTALPTDCVAGNIFVKTSATTGVYWCSTPGSPGTWTAVGGGGTGDVVGPSSATADRIAVFDGTTGKLLKDGGQTIAGITAGAGGLVLIEQHTASSSSSLDFTSFISSTYDHYLFALVGVLPATDGADLLARVGTGGGPSWDTGSNYYWFYGGHSLLGGFTGQGNPGTSFKIAPNIENSVTGVGGDFTIFNPQDTAGRKVIAWNTVANFADGNVGRMFGGAIWNSSTAVTGVQFFYSSGNIASGTIRVYGVAK